MKKFAIHLLSFTFASVTCGAAIAQPMAPPAEAGRVEKVMATVRTDAGDVMVSKQNEAFLTAKPNEPVKVGDRLMVGKDSVATVVYGDDDCEQKYDREGVYQITPSCCFSGDDDKKDGVREAVAKVRTDAGDIRVSQNRKDFFVARPDELVAKGDQLKVAKDSVATVIYSDNCEQSYNDEGTYRIQPYCGCPIALIAGSSKALVAGPWSPVGITSTAIVGGTIIWLLLDDDDDDQTPPVSR